MSDLDLLRRNLAAACHVLAKEGHADAIIGHLSARIDEETFLMKPAGLGIEEVSPEDLIVINLEGQKLAGKRMAHREIPIHSEIYRARPDVRCVVHTHPPFATTFGATSEELRPISHEGCRFWPGVPRFNLTSVLVTTVEQGQQLACSLGPGDGVFMLNHGVVVVGSSIQDASLNSIYLEKACRLQLMLINSQDYVYTQDEEASDKRKVLAEPSRVVAHWNYYLRKWSEPEINQNQTQPFIHHM